VRHPPAVRIEIVPRQRGLGVFVLEQHHCQDEADIGRGHMPLEQQGGQHIAVAALERLQDDLIARLVARHPFAPHEVGDLDIPARGGGGTVASAVAFSFVFSVALSHVHLPCAATNAA
jgi:hypothetical protein